jgi:hypothetical protein
MQAADMQGWLVAERGCYVVVTPVSAVRLSHHVIYLHHNGSVPCA